jgi:diguanylate cyclase (GGDEF)-like protein
MHEVPGDALPTGLIEVDSSDTVVAVNQLVERWAGADRVKLVGAQLSNILFEQPEPDRLDNEFLPATLEVAHVDGSRFPVLVAKGEADANGHRYLTLFDARAQHEARRRLLTRQRLVVRTQNRLELVIGASIAFAEARSEADLAEVLANTTASAYAAEEATVFLLDDDQVFQQVSGANPFEGRAETRRFTEQALQLRAVLKISGLDAAYAMAPEIGRAFEATGVQAIIVAPIHQGNQPIGILAAFFHHPRQFDEQASPLADALAGQAARAMIALRLQRRLEYAALHDDTTGLRNRRFLEESTDVAAGGEGEMIAVLFVDLDGFKAVNDRLGHHVGDALLRIVGQRLQSAIRETDVATRYGGDEFVIVCRVSTEDAATELAERIRGSLRAPYDILPFDLRIGASIGVSVTPAATTPLETDPLVRAADQAMYRAKFAGGDRIVAATF